MNTQNIITPFEFEDKLVRTVEVNGQLGWLTADLAKALGFSNIRATINTFPENEKGVINSDTLGGPQEMTYLTEPGLYRLIFRSNLPAAERFQTFVFHEVLPSIRKRGFYSRHTDQMLSFVRELMEMGFSAKDASILTRTAFPPLSKREREKQFLVVEAAETGDPGPADPDGDLFLSIMHPGQQYRVSDFFAVVPAHHWLLKKNERGRETAIGSILGRLCRLGKIRRVLKARHATYELPARDNVVSMK